MQFIQIKALAGSNFVRADQVIAIYATEPGKCTVAMAGGVTVPCSEPAKDVMERVEAATRAKQG
jgi:hypothetical protein